MALLWYGYLGRFNLKRKECLVPFCEQRYSDRDSLVPTLAIGQIIALIPIAR